MALGAVQWVKEAVAGTPVTTATQVLENFGSAEWGNDTTVDQPEFLDGTYALHSGGSTLGVMGHLSLRDGRLDFEQLPWFLSNSLKTAVPAGDAGVPIAYTYTFDPTLTADDAFNTGTYQAQNDTLTQLMPYGVTESFEIGLAGPRAPTTFGVELYGRTWADGALTAAVPHVTTEHVPGTAWAVSLDDTGGTIGTTLYTGCLKGFTFRSGPLRTPFECVEARQDFSGVARPRFNPSLTVRLAVTAPLAGVMTDWMAGTRQLIQLKALGTQIHAGTPVSKSVTIQMAGRITAMSRVGATRDQEQWIREVTFSGERDTTWAKLFKIIVVNAEAAIRV